MASRDRLVHHHCGDVAAAVQRRSGLPGALRVWRDSPAMGPWPAERHRVDAVRAAWWGVPDPEPPVLDGAPDPGPAYRPVLWFGPDPWEQACLLWAMAELPPDDLPDLVPLERSVGLLAPAALPPLFARRILLDEADLAAARELWARFLEGGWAALEGRGMPGLPWLAPALARLAEDHPPQGPGRSQRQVQALVDQGIRDLPGLMAGLRRLEAPPHGAWYGDLVVAKMVEAMGIRLG